MASQGPSARSIELVEKAGWLTKLGGKGFTSNWRRRWFILSGDYIYYYKSDIEGPPAGIISLQSFDTIVHDLECKRSRYCWKLFNSQQSYEAKPMRIYYAYAENEDEMKSWIEVVRQKLLHSSNSGSNHGTLVHNTLNRPKGANGRRPPTKKPSITTVDESDYEDDGSLESVTGTMNSNPSEGTVSSKKSMMSFGVFFKSSDSKNEVAPDKDLGSPRPQKPPRSSNSPVVDSQPRIMSEDSLNTQPSAEPKIEGNNTDPSPSGLPSDQRSNGSQRMGAKIQAFGVALPGMSAGPFNGPVPGKSFSSSPSGSFTSKPRSASENSVNDDYAQQRKGSADSIKLSPRAPPPVTAPTPKTPTPVPRSQSPMPTRNGSVSSSAPLLAPSAPIPMPLVPSNEKLSNGSGIEARNLEDRELVPRPGTPEQNLKAKPKPENFIARRADSDISRSSPREHIERTRAGSIKPQTQAPPVKPTPRRGMDEQDGMALVLHDEIMKLKKELELANADKKRLETELRTERDRSGQAVKIALDEQFELQNKLTKVENELHHSKVLRLSSSEGGGWKEEVEIVTAENDKLEEEISNLRRLLDQREQDLESAISHNVELETELCRARESLKNSDGDIIAKVAALKSDNEKFRVRERQVLSALQIARSGLQAAKAEIAAARKKAAYFELKASAQEMELLILQAQVDKNNANDTPLKQPTSVVKTIEDLMAEYAIQSEAEEVLENARNSIAMFLPDEDSD